MKVEKIVLNEAREVSLTAYLLDTGGEFRNICKRPAVLILPAADISSALKERLIRSQCLISKQDIRLLSLDIRLGNILCGRIPCRIMNRQWK